MTEVVENARLELLRKLAVWRDFAAHMAAEEPDPEYPGIAEMMAGLQPLGAGYLDPWAASSPGATDGERLFQNDFDSIALAARECAAIGHIELQGRDRTGPTPIHSGPGWWFVRITDAGYDWIKAHDALGELSQEPTP